MKRSSQIKFLIASMVVLLFIIFLTPPTLGLIREYLLYRSLRSEIRVGDSVEKVQRVFKRLGHPYDHLDHLRDEAYGSSDVTKMPDGTRADEMFWIEQSSGWFGEREFLAYVLLRNGHVVGFSQEVRNLGL